MLSGHFVWVSGSKGTAEMRTGLVSPLWTAEENYCFTFWFDLTVGVVS